jgi:hypothetical protein
MNLAKHFRAWPSSHGDLGDFADQLRLVFCPTHKCFCPEGHSCFKGRHSNLVSALPALQSATPFTQDARPQRKQTPSQKRKDAMDSDSESDCSDDRKGELREKARTYYKENRDRVRARQRQYYQRNKSAARDRYKERKSADDRTWLSDAETEGIAKNGPRLQNKQFRNAVIAKARRYLLGQIQVCAVCDEMCHEDEVNSYPLEDVPEALFEAVRIGEPASYNKHLIEYYNITSCIQGTEMKEKFDRLWLSKKGVVTQENRQLLTICETCDRSLCQSRQKKRPFPPALSIANGFMIGGLEDALYHKATATDLALVCITGDPLDCKHGDCVYVHDVGQSNNQVHENRGASSYRTSRWRWSAQDERTRDLVAQWLQGCHPDSSAFTGTTEDCFPTPRPVQFCSEGEGKGGCATHVQSSTGRNIWASAGIPGIRESIVRGFEDRFRYHTFVRWKHRSVRGPS